MDETSGRVIVVDDDPSILKAMQRLFASHWLEVLTFDRPRRFLDSDIVYRCPTCLVLDIRLPDMNGLDLQMELQTRNRCVPIVFITGFGEIPISVMAMKRGAVDFLPKPVDDADLIAAVKDALQKDRETKGVSEKIKNIRERLSVLTSREFEVLRHIISGLLNKQIAFELNISEKTVKVHRARVMIKMGAYSVPDLVRQCDLARIPPASAIDHYR